MKTRSFARTFQIPITLVAAIWVAFVLELILPFDAYRTLGIVPRTAGGALGILGMPLVHANFGHLMSNTLPLFVLATLLVAEGRSWGSIVAVIALNGTLLWLFGRGGRVHGGASGLVYGLAGLLVGAGLIQKKLVPTLIAFLVVILYGGALLSGVIPTHPGISWDGHLTGAIAGFAVATGSPKIPPKPEPAS